MRKETDAQVELARGGLGELSIYIDDRKVIDINKWLYPMPGKLVNKVKEQLVA